MTYRENVWSAVGPNKAFRGGLVEMFILQSRWTSPEVTLVVCAIINADEGSGNGADGSGWRGVTPAVCMAEDLNTIRETCVPKAAATNPRFHSHAPR